MLSKVLYFLELASVGIFVFLGTDNLYLAAAAFSAILIVARKV